MAANTKGIALVKELIAEYGLEVVQAYMKHIQVGGIRRREGGAWAAVPALAGRAVLGHGSVRRARLSASRRTGVGTKLVHAAGAGRARAVPQLRRSGRARLTHPGQSSSPFFALCLAGQR